MTRRLTLADLGSLAVPADPVLSPDGRTVVYVVRTVDADADSNRQALWLVDADDPRPRPLTRGGTDSAPRWSPDGSRLAFLRADDGPAQVWLLRMDGPGEPEQLTRLPLGAGAPVWSPDGTRLACIAPADRAAVDGETREDAERRRRHAPVVVDRLGYKADGTGLVRTLRQQLFVVDAATGDARQVTEGDQHVGAVAWHPDGSRLAVAAAAGEDADVTGAVPVCLVDADKERAPLTPVALIGGQTAALTWLPDGDGLLAVGRTDTETGHLRLLRIPVATGEPADLAARLDRNVMPGGPGYPGGLPQLTTDGGTVVFCARDRGCTNVFAVPVTGGDAHRILGDAASVVGGLSVATRADRIACLVATPHSYGEIVLADTASGASRTLTDHTRTALPDVDLLAPQERTFHVADGTEVHGWLLRDPGSAVPAPLLLDVHGGPHNAWSPVPDAGHGYQQVLAARGWAVLTLNPRGSDGYGEAFFTAGVGGWGERDEADFLAPVDALVDEGIADPARVAVHGYSYGGFMTCWLTGHTDRFAAAVAGGVVVDQTSMLASDVGYELARSETAALPWKDPERCAAQSPYASVQDVTTPTLILHGTADDRCPPGQAEQWFTALRARGVPTRLVLYPEASHLFILAGRPSHRIDYGQRLIDWLDEHTGRRRPMTTPSGLDSGQWRQRLADLAARHGVPGATLGILRGDDLVDVGCGVLSRHTGVEVTPDSLFQIGSITKVWTATLVMQLVDEGKLDLDQPVVDVLPEFAVADDDVTGQVTTRHLLTHTSGIDGDVFTDTGRGDDCVARYVETLRTVDQNHPLGATWSYCNAGYVVAGRVVERLTGLTWDTALRERVVGPLGLEHTVTLPEEALLHRAAVGHVAAEKDEPQPTAVWGITRSMGPAGLVGASVRDLLMFARMHLRDGENADGDQVLSVESARAMRRKEAELPDRHTLGDSWGLGWIRFGWDGHRLVGHDGNTIGQSAYLRILPEQDLAVGLLTNGGNTRDLFQDLYREVFDTVAGVRVPGAIEPPERPEPFDVSGYRGRYERSGALTEVFDGDDGLVLRTTVTGPMAEVTPQPVHEYRMHPVEPGLFAIRQDGTQSYIAVTFYQLDDGTPYVHYGARANPKVS